MTTKPQPQVMVKSTWADAEPGDYFECYPNKGTFLSIVEGKKGFGTVVFMDVTDTFGVAESRMNPEF